MADVRFTADTAGLHVLLNSKTGPVGVYMLRTGIKIQNSAKRRCPVDTGRLRASINVDVRADLSVEVGTKVNYALFVHEGTRYMHGRPFLREAMTEVVTSGGSAL